ncbi:hypothetical protein AWV80_12445 [Cupriavidus sp. UYMU48A]|nr:hypothetical protein AWV80_12445 [Cupriavidus sp. UYMU48A]
MAPPLHFAPRQEQPRVELQLVVARLHVLAQPVEGLVVLALLQVSDFVHDDHAQELRRGVLEQRRHAEFLLGLELAALHARDRGVQAQRLVGGFEARVVADLVQRRRAAQVFLLQFSRVVVQRAIGLHVVALWITAREMIAELAGHDQRAHLIQHAGRVAAQETHRVLRGRLPGVSVHRAWISGGGDGGASSRCPAN